MTRLVRYAWLVHVSAKCYTIPKEKLIWPYNIFSPLFGSALDQMARAAVLVPCQSDCAEVLPEDVSADEVLQVCMHNSAHTSVLRLTSGPTLCPISGTLAER